MPGGGSNGAAADGTGLVARRRSPAGCGPSDMPLPGSTNLDMAALAQHAQGAHDVVLASLSSCSRKMIADALDGQATRGAVQQPKQLIFQGSIQRNHMNPIRMGFLFDPELILAVRAHRGSCRS